MPDTPVLRLLDANLNRAREALRVMEDYARFALDDQALSAALKGLRHDLAQAARPFADDAILHRDTPGDVGVANKTPAEARRRDAGDVVRAAGKRLTEALRAIEEYAKIQYPASAAQTEALRYRAYDLEQKLARTLAPAQRFAAVRLYVLVTESLCRRPWLEAAEQAILGGADCIQLREKGLDDADLLGRARDLVRLCRAHGVLSIINDRPDIALLADADGVHLGQEDLPAAVVRKLMGAGKIIGVSTHAIEQARQAVRDGVDYVAAGPIFPSQTKPRDFTPGIDYARQAAGEISIPVVAIAGITPENVDKVLAAGIKAVAVTAAVFANDDVRSAAATLKARMLPKCVPTP